MQVLLIRSPCARSSVAVESLVSTQGYRLGYAGVITLKVRPHLIWECCAVTLTGSVYGARSSCDVQVESYSRNAVFIKWAYFLVCRCMYYAVT